MPVETRHRWDNEALGREINNLKVGSGLTTKFTPQ